MGEWALGYDPSQLLAIRDFLLKADRFLVPGTPTLFTQLVSDVRHHSLDSPEQEHIIFIW